MSEIKDGGQAVACLTLRDYFAGQALIGMVTTDYISVAAKAIEIENRKDVTVYDVQARMAYHIADAMLAERSKSHD